MQGKDSGRMKGIYKETDEKDSRALKEKFFNRLNGDLKPFIDVLKDDSRLELCFRGNQEPNQAVTIYYKNHQMFKIYDTGKISFNYNHARYCEPDVELEYRKKLIELKFNVGKKFEKIGIKPEDFNKKGVVLDIKDVTRTLANNQTLEEQEIKDLINDVLIPMFDTFFNKNKKYDYFKHKEKKDKGELAEKEDQQKLYSIMKNSKAGYYFYDMEISKKHSSKTELDNDKSNNKADMMAVEFDDKGEPVNIVFVEVKTKKSAYYGKSGLDVHIEKTKQISKEYIETRKIEAYKIIHQYHKLGLRTVEDINKIDYNAMTKMGVQILVVLTREAKDYWNEYERKYKWSYKKKYKKECSYTFEKCPSEKEEIVLYKVKE